MPILYMTTDEGELEIELPTKKIVCPKCKGEGTHIHDAFIEDSFTQYDADRDGLDFDEEVSYMQSGRYDVPCTHCNGTRVVDAVDMTKLSDDEKSAWKDQVEDMRECEAIMKAERAMGA